MILRVTRGKAGPEQIEALQATLERNAARETARGRPLRLHVGTRPAGSDLDVLILALWTSAEAAASADAKRASPLFLARSLGLDCEASHYEIDETAGRISDEEPVALRIATGRFSKPGTDIEMQELLRDRVPEVGEDMTEAYVGRCLIGKDIYVTFVSAWRRVPRDRSLDEPFWSDIALRYDHFSVEVYTTLALRPPGSTSNPTGAAP